MSAKDLTNPLSFNDNTYLKQSPSCRLATSRAYNKMKQILFKSFSFEKWLILAFCVWLANMFEGYGQNFSFYNNYNTDNVSASNIKNIDFNAEITSFINNANAFTESKLGISLTTLVIIGLIIITFIYIIIFILLWLKARFNFVLIDNLKSNAQKIQEPWSEYKQVGNSCFWWNIGFQAIFFAIGGILFIIFFIGFFYYTVTGTGNFNHNLLITVLIMIPFILVFSLAYLVIIIFFYHFVVPIMYKMKIKSIPAWGEFNKLFKTSPSSFIKYLFVLFIYNILAVIIVALVVICTCCLLGCLFSLPVVGGYIASLILLPIYVFFRLFNIEFLAQFGKDYDLEILKNNTIDTQQLITESTDIQSN